MDTSLMPQAKKTEVWYKEPWLLLVIGGPLAVVCASIFTGFIAWQNSDKVVAEDYYKQGLMINKDIQRDARAASLNLAAELTLESSSGEMKLHLSGNGQLPETIQLSLANASNTGMSVNEVARRMPLNRVSDGNYVGVLPNKDTKIFQAKLFHVKLETIEWRLTGDWFAPEQRKLQINAAK